MDKKVLLIGVASGTAIGGFLLWRRRQDNASESDVLEPSAPIAYAPRAIGSSGGDSFPFQYQTCPEGQILSAGRCVDIAANNSGNNSGVPPTQVPPPATEPAVSPIQNDTGMGQLGIILGSIFPQTGITKETRTVSGTMVALPSGIKPQSAPVMQQSAPAPYAPYSPTPITVGPLFPQTLSKNKRSSTMGWG